MILSSTCPSSLIVAQFSAGTPHQYMSPLITTLYSYSHVPKNSSAQLRYTDTHKFTHMSIHIETLTVTHIHECISTQMLGGMHEPGCDQTVPLSDSYL